jgi:hypothetical protein
MQTTSLPSRTHARQRGAAPAGGGPGRRRGRQVDREHGYGLCATEAMGARNIDLTKFLFCSIQPSFNCGRERKLSSRPISAGQSMSNSLFSLVLLDNPVTPDMSAVAKVLRARHPELATEVGENGAVQQAQANSPLIRCGNELVAVMSMPARIPDDAGLWSRAAGTWSESKSVAARHRGHLIVSVLGQNQRALPSARLTTAVIGALIATMPECCAVVWNGRVARSAELWLDLSSRSFARLSFLAVGGHIAVPIKDRHRRGNDGAVSICRT